jgi:hypothetical protein
MKPYEFKKYVYDAFPLLEEKNIGDQKMNQFQCRIKTCVWTKPCLGMQKHKELESKQEPQALSSSHLQET